MLGLVTEGEMRDNAIVYCERKGGKEEGKNKKRKKTQITTTKREGLFDVLVETKSALYFRSFNIGNMFLLQLIPVVM